MYNKNMMQRHRRTPMNSECNNAPYVNNPQTCEYGFTEINKPSLAMVYSVSQKWRFINDGCEGFDRGTIFDELNKPFAGDKCKRGGRCK